MQVRERESDMSHQNQAPIVMPSEEGGLESSEVGVIYSKTIVSTQETLKGSVQALIKFEPRL
jgi:hypothetical protein